MSFTISAAGHFETEEQAEAFATDVIATLTRHNANGAITSFSLGGLHLGDFDSTHIVHPHNRPRDPAEPDMPQVAEFERQVNRGVGNPTGPRYDADGRKLSPQDALEAVAEHLTPEQAADASVEVDTQLSDEQLEAMGFTRVDWDALTDEERIELAAQPVEIPTATPTADQA